MRIDYNFFSFLQNYLLKKTTVSNLPLELSVELTNICNFHCIFCPQSDGSHLDRIGRHTLDPDAAEYILQKIRDLGYKRQLLHWTLDGEPFVNKNYAQIFSIAKKYNFTVQRFATNGYFLSQNVLNSLPDGIKYILSVDFCADKEYFEYTRGTQGSWEVIRQNISHILSNNYPNIELVINDISGFGDYSDQELDKQHQNLKNMFPESSRVSYRTRNFHNAAGFLNKFPKQNNSKYHLCPYPWSSLYIASNGDVVACCRDLEHKSVLGNVFHTEDISSIWNGSSMLAFRENLIYKDLEKNKACEFCDLPWDDSKFSLSNKLHTLSQRFAFRSSRDM